MIRSTVNATTKTIDSSGMKSESLEVCEGSLDGIAASALHEMSEKTYDANKVTNPNTTISIVPSDAHNPA